MKKQKVKCLNGVGITLDSEKYTQDLISTNQIQRSFIYMQGGIEIHGLKRLKKSLIKMMYQSFKKNPNPENRYFIEANENPKDYIASEIIEGLAKRIKEL